MADIDHDARAFKAWITKEKALNFQTSEFEEERLEQDVSLFPSSFDQSAALIVLRACKVNVVSIAAGLQEIIVGLEIMPSRRDETALPSRTRSGHAISYQRLKKPQPTLPTSAVSLAPSAALYGGLYPCGSSISAADRPATGTLGCLVTKNSKLYGLTNNHVTGKYSLTKPGMPILAPGLVDAQPGNLDPFTIGHHAHCAPWVTGTPDNVPIAGNLDLAIFEITYPSRVTSHQGQHFDTPVTVAKTSDVRKARHTPVWKVGRTTDLTSGFLTGQAIGTIEVLMNDPAFKSPVHFNDVLMIRDPVTNTFARPGDSGSLVVWEKNGQYEAVGIIFCVNFNDRMTYLLPMEEVLNRLQVGLVGQHNVQGSSHPSSRTP